MMKRAVQEILGTKKTWVIEVASKDLFFDKYIDFFGTLMH